MYKDNANLFEEEQRSEEDLKKKESEILPKQEEIQVSEEYMSTLSVENQQKVSLILNKSHTSPEEFNELLDFLGDTPAPETLAVQNDKLSFNISSPKGVNIPVLAGSDEVILKDRGEDVKIKIGDKEQYQLESEIFDVENELVKMEQKSEAVIPKEFRKFYTGRDLAKFVNFISRYRVTIDGEYKETVYEVRSIYDYLLHLPKEKIYKLHKDIEKAQDDRELYELAMKEQKNIV